MTIQEKLPSRLEVVPGFIASVIEKIKHLSFNEEEVFGIRLSLEEAIVNAIRHGNKLNAGLAVEVTVKVQENCLVITVKDQGEGFDFKNTPDPTKTDNRHKPSGRGIFLIRKMMDRVRYSDCGRRLEMTKCFKTGGKS